MIFTTIAVAHLELISGAAGNVVPPMSARPTPATQSQGSGINWQKVGEYAAPALLLNPSTAVTGWQMLNKPAAAQGAVWGAGGAIAGSAGGPEGTALGAAGGAVAGYYGTLVGRDFPVH